MTLIFKSEKSSQNIMQCEHEKKKEACNQEGTRHISSLCLALLWDPSSPKPCPYLPHKIKNRIQQIMPVSSSPTIEILEPFTSLYSKFLSTIIRFSHSLNVRLHHHLSNRKSLSIHTLYFVIHTTEICKDLAKVLMATLSSNIDLTRLLRLLNHFLKDQILPGLKLVSEDSRQ